MVRAIHRVFVQQVPARSRHRLNLPAIGLAIVCAFAMDCSPAGAQATGEGPRSTAKSAGESPAKQVRRRVVMRSDGKPVANADVRLVAWRNNNTHYDTKKTRTDAKGEFVFEKVTAGKLRIVAFFEDYASRQTMYKGDAVDLTSQEPLTLTLDKMPSIEVQVVSKADAKPIPARCCDLFGQMPKAIIARTTTASSSFAR